MTAGVKVRQAMLALATLFAGALGAQQPEPTASLVPFGRMVGGTWVAEGSEQTFEWGLGKRSVIANSYFVAEDGTRTLVGQAFWYWDPEARGIQGVSVAEGMPFEVVEIRARFDGDTLISELRTIAADGSTASNVETWKFTGADTYEWTLHAGGLDSDVWMTATYQRR